MKCVVYGVGFSFQVIVNLISLTCSKCSPYRARVQNYQWSPELSSSLVTLEGFCSWVSMKTDCPKANFAGIWQFLLASMENI